MHDALLHNCWWIMILLDGSWWLKKIMQFSFMFIYIFIYTGVNPSYFTSSAYPTLSCNRHCYKRSIQVLSWPSLEILATPFFLLDVHWRPQTGPLSVIDMWITSVPWLNIIPSRTARCFLGSPVTFFCATCYTFFVPVLCLSCVLLMSSFTLLAFTQF